MQASVAQNAPQSGAMGMAATAAHAIEESKRRRAERLLEGRGQERMSRLQAHAKLEAPVKEQKELAGRNGLLEPAVPVEAPQLVMPAVRLRRRRTLWEFGVWFSGLDWVRFAVAAIVVVLLG